MMSRPATRVAAAVLAVGVAGCAPAPPREPPGPRYSLSRMYTATRERVTWRAPETDPETFSALFLRPLRVRVSPWPTSTGPAPAATGAARSTPEGIAAISAAYDRVFRGMLAGTIPLVERPGPGVLVVSASLTERVDEPHLRELAQRFGLADIAGRLRGIALEMVFRRHPDEDPIAALLTLESGYLYPAALAGRDPDPSRAFQPVAMALKLALSRVPITEP